MSLLDSQSAGAPFVKSDRLATGLIAVFVAIIFIGFAKNFYLRPWLGTRPLTMLAYAHAAVMSAWLLLFVLQVLLISRQRLVMHRSLGKWGAAIAAFLVLLGVLTIGAAAQRNHETGSVSHSLVVFVAYDGLSLILFGLLVGYAIYSRTRPAVHRRLMLMAMVALLPPAFGRMIAYVTHEHVEITVLVAMIAIVMACIAIDVRKTGHVHRAILIPAVAILAVNALTYLAQIWI